MKIFFCTVICHEGNLSYLQNDDHIFISLFVWARSFHNVYANECPTESGSWSSGRSIVLNGLTTPVQLGICLYLMTADYKKSEHCFQMPGLLHRHIYTGTTCGSHHCGRLASTAGTNRHGAFSQNVGWEALPKALTMSENLFGPSEITFSTIARLIFNVDEWK